MCKGIHNPAKSRRVDIHEWMVTSRDSNSELVPRVSALHQDFRKTKKWSSKLARVSIIHDSGNLTTLTPHGHHIRVIVLTRDYQKRRNGAGEGMESEDGHQDAHVGYAGAATRAGQNCNK